MSAPYRLSTAFGVAVVFVLLTLLGVSASPAIAHGGPISAQATVRAGDEVSVFIYYERDLHPVELESAVVSARLDGGEAVELPLEPTGSHPGLWRLPEGSLGAGAWTLSIEYSLDGVVGTVPRELHVVIDRQSSDPAARTGAVPVWPFSLVGGLILASGGAIALVVLRRRARAHPATASDGDLQARRGNR